MSVDLAWPIGPEAPDLIAPEVHLWRAMLDQSQAIIERLARTLNEEEQDRASRYHFEHDRLRFIVNRGILRDILARYLGCYPEVVEFYSGRRGKPELVLASRSLPIRFSVSHSRDIGLYAVAHAREVGVDVEFVRQVPQIDLLIQSVFSKSEMARLQGLPQGERSSSFYSTWTRKEAFVKATGEGLTKPMAQVEIYLGMDQYVESLSVGPLETVSADWSVVGLSLIPGYAGAIVVEGREWKLVQWQWIAFR